MERKAKSLAVENYKNFFQAKRSLRLGESKEEQNVHQEISITRSNPQNLRRSFLCHSKNRCLSQLQMYSLLICSQRYSLFNRVFLQYEGVGSTCCLVEPPPISPLIMPKANERTFPSTHLAVNWTKFLYSTMVFQGPS